MSVAVAVGTVKQRNFHTGLDPVSRTKNSAKPSELTVTLTPLINVRFAQLSFLDTGLNPVWSVVGDGGDGVGGGAVVGDTIVTVTVTVGTVTVTVGTVAVTVVAGRFIGE